MKRAESERVKTPATLYLDRHQLPYQLFQCTGEIEGTAEFMANFLGVPAYEVIKSIVFMDEKHHGYMVLQHGDHTIDTKKLRKILGVKSIRSAPYEYAHKWTGYQFGGTSPFGIKADLPIYAEESIFQLESFYINGGQRGVNIKITPDLLTYIGVTPISVTK